ncbi:MAG: radical SAM protein [Candidatus Omnitrophota bacterium]
MRVGFVYSEMETLGIEHLSSFLKKQGHQTRLFFDPQLFMDTISSRPVLNKILGYRDHLLKQIDEFKPDILAFSVLSTNNHWAKLFAKEIKIHTDIPIVFGGIHPTLAPEEVIKLGFVDHVIVGEGEEALCELVENLNNLKNLSEIKNVWTKINGKIVRNPVRPLIEDLDSLPFPDKEMFYQVMPYLSKHYTIVTGRGCPYSCTFCSNHALRNISNSDKHFLRRRSPENVIAELNQAKSKYQVKDIFFDDSTFTYDKKWLKRFSDLYRGHINLNCFCWVHPSEIDEETVGYLKNMNCRAVEMGVESTNPQIREKWLHRYYSNEQVARALRLFKKHKIFCVVDNIIGLPEEKISDLEDMVSFYNEIRPEKVYVFELRPFPNTQMYEMSKEYAAIHNNDRDDLRPFTLSVYRNKVFKQIIMLTLMIEFLPKKAISFLLRKKLYRFLPAFDVYNFLEIVPFFLNFLKREKRWFPIRGTRHRYIFFGLKILKNYFSGNSPGEDCKNSIPLKENSVDIVLPEKTKEEVLINN